MNEKEKKRVKNRIKQWHERDEKQPETLEFEKHGYLVRVFIRDGAFQVYIDDFDDEEKPLHLGSFFNYDDAAKAITDFI